MHFFVLFIIWFRIQSLNLWICVLEWFKKNIDEIFGFLNSLFETVILVQKCKHVCIVHKLKTFNMRDTPECFGRTIMFKNDDFIKFLCPIGKSWIPFCYRHYSSGGSIVTISMLCSNFQCYSQTHMCKIAPINWWPGCSDACLNRKVGSMKNDNIILVSVWIFFEARTSINMNTFI